MSIRVCVLLFALFLAGIVHAEGSYNLGVEAYKKKDFQAARLHWSAAVEEGEPLALNNLAYLLYSGLGGEPEIDRAIALWRRAAEAGVSEAQSHLGYAYSSGKGAPQDTVAAYAWYKCAVFRAEALSAGEAGTEEEIAGEAARSLVRLLEKLTPEKFKMAEELSVEFISKYGSRKNGT